MAPPTRSTLLPAVRRRCGEPARARHRAQARPEGVAVRGELARQPHVAEHRRDDSEVVRRRRGGGGLDGRAAPRGGTPTRPTWAPSCRRWRSQRTGHKGPAPGHNADAHLHKVVVGAGDSPSKPRRRCVPTTRLDRQGQQQPVIRPAGGRRRAGTSGRCARARTSAESGSSYWQPVCGAGPGPSRKRFRARKPAAFVRPGMCTTRNWSSATSRLMMADVAAGVAVLLQPPQAGAVGVQLEGLVERAGPQRLERSRQQLQQAGRIRALSLGRQQSAGLGPPLGD